MLMPIISPDTLVEREIIRDIIARVARGEDRRNEELLRSAFWPDATIDFGVMSGGFKDYLSWCVPGSPDILVTHHRLGQSMISMRGDTAKVETYVQSYHRVKTEDGQRDTAMGGRYLDDFSKQYGNWRIASRIMLYDYDLDIGPAMDISKGLMGMAFSADHYTGRSGGDFSETWFA